MLHTLSRRVPALVLVGLALLAGCKSSPKASTEPATAKLDRAVTMMTGAFASTAQHERDSENFFDIRLRMTPIWPARTTDVQKWLYVEQARATALDKPYRQRIYRVSLGQEAGTVVSEVFELPGGKEGAAKFAGAWKTPDAFDTITPEQLDQREGCDVVLRESAAGVFEGGTIGKNCLSSLRGATYAVSEVRMDARGLTTWDRGFDESDKHVWGAEKGGYEFVRVAN
jgi:CpeT protein